MDLTTIALTSDLKTAAKYECDDAHEARELFLLFFLIILSPVEVSYLHSTCH